jgi:hypothetical protein
MPDRNQIEQEWRRVIVKERSGIAKKAMDYWGGALPLGPVNLHDCEETVADVLNPNIHRLYVERAMAADIAKTKPVDGAVASELARPPRSVGSGVASVAPRSVASTELTSISRRKPAYSRSLSNASLTSSRLQVQVEELVREEVQRELQRVIEPMKDQLAAERAQRLMAEGRLARARMSSLA